MKKIFLAAVIVLAAVTVTSANDSIGSKERKEARMERRQARKEIRKDRAIERRSEVNVLTRDQFAMDFPDARNVHFVRDESFDKVIFTSGKHKLTAYYDNQSALLGTAQTKAFADLPQNAQKKILKDYSGYTVSHVIKYDDNEFNENTVILYGGSFDADNYFVELTKADKKIVVKSDLSGDVSYFSTMK